MKQSELHKEQQKSSEPEVTIYQHWKLGSYIQTTAILSLVSDLCVLRNLKIAYTAAMNIT